MQWCWLKDVADYEVREFIFPIAFSTIVFTAVSGQADQNNPSSISDNQLKIYGFGSLTSFYCMSDDVGGYRASISFGVICVGI